MAVPREEVEQARLGPYNVVASFAGHQKAKEAKHALRERGVPNEVMVLGSQTDDAESLKAEMREEVEHSVGGGGLALHNREQFLGATKGSIVGAIVGALIGFLIGAVFLGTTAMVIATITFAIGGFVAGGVSGGLSEPRGPEQERDVHTAARTTLGVHTDDPEHVELAIPVLEGMGADRVDRFDQQGDPYKEAKGERDWH